MTAVFVPSEVPALTSTGRTNSPSLSQTVPMRPSPRPSPIAWEREVPLLGVDVFGVTAGGFASGSGAFQERASGDISAREEGVQRRAALGTRRALVSLRA